MRQRQWRESANGLEDVDDLVLLKILLLIDIINIIINLGAKSW